jgi:hypothetical protein
MTTETKKSAEEMLSDAVSLVNGDDRAEMLGEDDETDEDDTE